MTAAASRVWSGLYYLNANANNVFDVILATDRPPDRRCPG